MTAVAVGLPVRNGAPLLAQALACLTAQDHHDLDIVVCDNASTDETERICRDAAARDPRIRYVRWTEDRGAAENFNRAFALTEAPYFFWAAHDDRFLPDFVTRTLAELERHPEAAMCLPGIRMIDESDSEIEIQRPDPRLCSSDVRVRLRGYLDRYQWFYIYALLRREVLAQIMPRPIPPPFGADVVLVWNLLLRAPARTVADVLFEYRRYRSKTVQSVLAGLLPEVSVRQARFSHVELLQSLWAAAGDEQLPPKHTRLARQELARWAVSSRFRTLLFTDLLIEAARARSGGHLLRATGFAAAAAAVLPSRAVRGVLRLVRERRGPLTQ